MANLKDCCSFCYLMKGSFISHSSPKACVRYRTCFRCGGNSCYSTQTKRTNCSLIRDVDKNSCFSCYLPWGAEGLSIHLDSQFGTANCRNQDIKEVMMLLYSQKPKTLNVGNLTKQQFFDHLWKDSNLGLPNGLWLFVKLANRDFQKDLD
jgi:hypothetical protein